MRSKTWLKVLPSMPPKGIPSSASPPTQKSIRSRPVLPAMNSGWAIRAAASVRRSATVFSGAEAFSGTA